MVKMCKVNDLLSDGYSYKTTPPWHSELGGGVNKCLKVNDLINYFHKNNFDLSVLNRDGMRLFPKSEVVVNYPYLQWSNDGDWAELSLDNGTGSYTENTYYLTYFGGDVTSITCSVISLNGEDIGKNEVLSLGLDFSIKNIVVEDETDGSYQMDFRLTYVDDAAFAEGEEINSIGIEICGKGMNGKSSCTEAEIAIYKNGTVSGSTTKGKITISPNSLTIAPQDGGYFNVAYEKVQPSSLKIQSIVTSFGDIECNIDLNNPTETTGTAYLRFYQPDVSKYRGNIYDVYLTGYDINGKDTQSNTVKLDID